MRRKKVVPVSGDITTSTESETKSTLPTAGRVVNFPWPKIFLGIALLATVLGALIATKALANVEKNIARAKEEARPANIKITKITVPNCADCFNVEDAVAVFKKQNISVGEEKALLFESSEAQSLIKQLGIKKIPTYLATGEITKSNLESFIKNNGEIREDTFIFTKATPVFVDTESRKEIGRVTVTYLTDPLCTGCIDPKLTVESYKKAGIKIAEERQLAWNSPEAQNLIAKYKITKLPTFLLSSDIDNYDTVKTNWTNIGTVEEDKTYIARNLFLPYRDLEKGKIVGLIDLIYLTDATCKDCYDPIKTQKNILTQGYGVVLRSERTVDTSSLEGRNLVSQYKVTKVPTIILSPETDDYAGLKNVWKSVGTVEPNGWYVFREMGMLGSVTYKDLTTNQIVSPAQQPASTGQSNQ